MTNTNHLFLVCLRFSKIRGRCCVETGSCIGCCVETVFSSVDLGRVDIGCCVETVFSSVDLGRVSCICRGSRYAISFSVTFETTSFGRFFTSCVDI